MKIILEEYGQAIFYAMIGLICIGLLILFLIPITTKDNFKTKTSVYNADSYNKEVAPSITVKSNVINVPLEKSGYQTDTQVLQTLYQLGVYEVKRGNIKIDPFHTSGIILSMQGVVDTSQEGNYNITISVTDKYATNSEGLTVCVKHKNTHSY